MNKMTLQEGDKLVIQGNQSTVYEVISNPIYTTDAENKEHYVVGFVLKEVDTPEENILDQIYMLCEDCQGRQDGFNCPVQSKLDRDYNE